MCDKTQEVTYMGLIDDVRKFGIDYDDAMQRF